MIKAYFSDLFKRVKNAKKVTKVLIALIFLIEVFFLVISFVKVDVEVLTPGFINEASNVISIGENNSQKKGSIYTVSVYSNTKTSLIQYWIALNEKRVSVSPIDDTITTEQEAKYGVLVKRVAINNAIIFAYREAKKIDDSIFLDETFHGLLVEMILSNAETELEPDDIITAIEGTKINSYDDFSKIYDELLGPLTADGENSIRKGGTKNSGDFIKFTVDRYNDEKGEYVSLEKTTQIGTNAFGGLTTGLILEEYYKLNGKNSNPQFTITYDEKRDSSGNSGGAMMALSIYNSLLNGEITNNKFICGTGTISIDGKVGAIGGIEQKVVTAYMAQADYFFVDSTDYDDAIAACKKYGYDDKFIIEVKTFDDILNALREE